MNSDFNKNTFDIWVDNYKRPKEINETCRSWLNSTDVDQINVIVNHSSINQDTFDEDIRSKIKIWPNIMRHDLSRGPITRSINQAYIHTFLSGKKYCVVAHDNMLITPGWDSVVQSTDFEFYSAPMGDQVHIMSVDGLRKLGWWDERYATMSNHELDYLVRAIRKARNNQVNISVVDGHLGWPNQLPFVRNNSCFYNDCGLQNYFSRMSKVSTPQVGPSRSPVLEKQMAEWNNSKWPHSCPTHLDNIIHGPLISEVNWYPWIDLNDLSTNHGIY